MEKLSLLKKLLFVVAALASSIMLNAQNAEVQIIHNSADPAAENIAVWVVDGMTATKAVDSLKFRKATPYLSLPANTPIKIAISPAGATSINDSIAGLTTEITLMKDSNYVAMAIGNIGAGFSPNPDNKNTNFKLLVVPRTRMSANSPLNTDFLVMHGATDVPAVDLYVRGNMSPLVNNAAYGDFTPYYSVVSKRYFLDLTLANSTTPLTTLEADFAPTLGSSLIVFASGYLKPNENKGGKGLGVFIATAGGNVIQLKTARAKAQIIHNSADPAAANVAVWIIDGMGATKVIDSLEFRKATPYIDVPAGRDIKIAFSPAGAMDITDTIAGLTTKVTLMEDSNYVAMAVGNIGTGFSANPDNKNTNFKLLVVPRTRMMASSPSNTDFLVMHGATDVPAIDLYVKGSMNPLVNDAAYGDFTSYYSIPAQHYLLDLTLANSTNPLTTLDLDFSSTAGSSLVIFASGYLQPNANKNGEAVGIFIATSGGNIVKLNPPTTRVQIIHNSADPSLASLDVYTSTDLGSEKILDNFDFRTTTGYITMPAIAPFKISFARGNTSSIADTLPGLAQNVMLDTGKNYIAMLMGNNRAATFEPSPNSRDIIYKVLFVEDSRVDANNIADVDVVVMHGSTDIPAIDIVNDSNKTILANDIKYGEATNYLSLMPTKYRILVQDSINSTTIGSYDLPLTNYAGRSAVVFASGYLSPANDNSGPAFGLFAAIDDQVIGLTQTTSVYEVNKTIDAKVYPNPATTNLNIEFTLTNNSPLTLEVYDNIGRVIYTETTKGLVGNNTLKVNTSTFKTGVYFYTLKTKDGINTTRFAVTK